MPLPRLPCATALALGLTAAATPAATLQAMPQSDASDALFRGFLYGPVAAPGTSFPLPGEANASGEEGSSAPGWLDGNGRYVVGGAAALAMGIVLAGNDHSPTLSTVSTPAPVATPEAAPTADAPIDLGSTNVIVNPEPGTVLLLGTGLALIVLIGRRKITRG